MLVFMMILTACCLFLLLSPVIDKDVLKYVLITIGCICLFAVLVPLAPFIVIYLIVDRIIEALEKRKPAKKEKAEKGPFDPQEWLRRI